MEDLKQIQEFFSKPLNEGKQLDIEDFAKVVQAVTKTGHPVTVLLTPKFNEIEIITGMNAPDDMLRDLSNAVDSLGYGRNDIIIAGDSSNLSRREYSDIRRVNGGHKDYFEESINEVKVDYDFSERELIRVLRQLKRGASTEIDMIKAFTKALGRDITKDELFSESVNEVKRPEPDYKQLVKLLIMAFKHEPKARFYFNRNNGVVYFDLIGGAAYSPKKSKMRDIFGGMNPIAVNREFGRADHYEEETIKQVEQLSNGKIKAEIKELGDGVLYKLASVNKSTINENKKEYNPDQEQLDDEDEIFMPYDDEGRPLEEEADHVSPIVVKAYKEYLKAKKEGNGEKAYRYYSKKLNNTYSTRADRDAIEAILKKKYGSALEESVNEGAEEIMDAYNDVLDLVKKHSRNLSDDDSYAFGLKLKAWFNKNILSEEKKLTYNNFIQMVRDDMMAGAAPDEYPSDERVRKDAKYLYNRYLQGASVDDLFEATKEEETEFHTKLDKLVHDTFGKRKGEMEEYNTGLYYSPDKEKYAVKTKQASKSGLEKVRDFVKKVMKEEEITVDDATEFKVQLKHLLDKHVVKNEELSDYEEKEVNYDELYSDYKYKVNEAKPKKGHGEKISKEVFAKLKGKTINYKGSDYKVVDSDEAVLTLKDEDGKSKTINLRQFNVSGMIDEIIETIELGKNLNEELCPKGKAYIKKRQAAGEKSSAYLSGRAVKVCKGQMKG